MQQVGTPAAHAFLGMVLQQVGTPAAAAVPLMVGLDFPAMSAVIAGSMINSTPWSCRNTYARRSSHNRITYKFKAYCAS
ncbi:hypothetical protein DP73_01930 [Desulfosporosinus sp. HMP52]|nr:hypothetical protein DP73_01930 [Desulfosporosinus sp. HMP52]